MYTLTYSQIESEFNTSREVATLGLSLFVVGLGTGPAILSPVCKQLSSEVQMLTARSFLK